MSLHISSSSTYGRQWEYERNMRRLLKSGAEQTSKPKRKADWKLDQHHNQLISTQCCHKKVFLGWVTSTSSPARCCRWFQRQGWQPWLATSCHAVKPAALLTEHLPLWWWRWIHSLNPGRPDRRHPQHSQSRTESFSPGPGYHLTLEVWSRDWKWMFITIFMD